MTSPIRRAFTLIELLVVVAIIAVLAGMIVASIGPVREAARRTSCSGNLRAIGQAIVAYTTDNEGGFPHMVVSATPGWGVPDCYADNTWMHQLAGDYQLGMKPFDCPSSRSRGPAPYPWMGSASPTASCVNAAVEYFFNAHLGVGADKWGHGNGTGRLATVQFPSVTLLVGEGRYPSFHDSSSYLGDLVTTGVVIDGITYLRGHSRGMSILCCDGHVEYAKAGDTSRGLRWTPDASWDVWHPNPASLFW